MTNTIDYTNKDFQNVTIAVMNDILNSDVNGSSMDDVYNTVCKYAKITKEQFTEYYKLASQKIDEWTNEGKFSGELSEQDLDMVVGGSMSSFFNSLGDGISTAAKAVGNFVKEAAPYVGVVIGIAAMLGGVAMMFSGNGAGLIVGIGGYELMVTSFETIKNK